MIEREKAIKEFEHLLNEEKGDYQDFVDVTVDFGEEILALLKEQEAVEARKKSNGIPQPWASWWYVCGDCGQEIEYHDRFCRWCGRSVKWK